MPIYWEVVRFKVKKRARFVIAFFVFETDPLSFSYECPENCVFTRKIGDNLIK